MRGVREKTRKGEKDMSEHATAMATNQPTSLAAHQAHPARRTNVGDGERLLSVIGGGALALYGLRRSLGSLALAIGGGVLVYRGISGHCAVYENLGIDTTSREGAGSMVEATVTINKPVAEVYRFYRTLGNHPHFVTHLESVQTTDTKHSHWVARMPLQQAIEWDAEIVEERENALLSWRSLPGADVDNAGTVRFRELPGGRGTEVRISLEYYPPGGVAGAALANLLNTITTQQLREDMRHFKQILEAGEQPTIANQPVGRQG
jgi:uncharacterized membrane protein